jgi:hypothetical protein
MLAVCYFKKLDIRGPRKQRVLLSVRGILGTISLILIFYAVKFINPSDVSAIFNCNIVIVTIFARFFLKEKLSFCHLIALVCTVFGIFLVSQPSFLFPKKSTSLENFDNHLIFYDTDSIMDDLEFINPNGNNCTQIKVFLNSSDQTDMEKKYSYLAESFANSSKLSHKYSLSLNESAITLKNMNDKCKSKEESPLKQVVGFRFGFKTLNKLTVLTRFLKVFLISI